VVRMLAQPKVWRGKAGVQRLQKADMIEVHEHLIHASREDGRPAPAMVL
jgi:hypothetical protein